MGQSLAIPRVIPKDWKRLDLIVNKIKMRLGSTASPTHVGLTLTGLTASTLIGVNASKALESVTIGTGLDYTRPTLSLSHLGIESLTDPGADRILFWDDSETACKWLSVGNSIAITTTTLDTIQDIRTTASPTFANLSLGTGELTCGSINRATGTLTFEIGGTAELSLTSTNLTLESTHLAIKSGYGITFYDQDNSHYVHITAPNIVTTSLTYSWPPADGNNNDVLTTDSNGVLSWSSKAPTPGGDNEDIQFNDGGTLSGSNSLYWDKTNSYFGIVGLTKIHPFSGAPGEVRFYDIASSDYVGFKGPDATSETSVWSLPGADGAANEVLGTTGGFGLIWRNHDEISGFVANEHIDHTSVTLTAGTGLTGGGDISANRTFAVDGVLEDLDTLGANSADSEFLVGTAAGALAWESGTTVRTSIGLGTGDSPTFTGLTLSGTATIEGASVTVGKASTTTGTLVLHDSNSANTITLTVPDISAGSLTFTLPPTDGANTNVLQTDGNGVLTWVAAGGAGAHTHDGDTLQLDAINSDGGAFAFTTSGAVTFSQNIILPDGGTLGQAAGPLLTFDDTANALTISGCQAYIVNDSTNPQLTVRSNLLANIEVQQHHNTGTEAAYFTYRRSRGTAASPTANSAGDILGVFNAIGYTNGWQTAARIVIGCDTGWGATGTDAPGFIYFRVSPDGSSTPVTKLSVKQDGKIGLGTESPADHLHLYSGSPQIRQERTGTGGAVWTWGVSYADAGNYGSLYITTDEDNSQIYFRDSSSVVTLGIDTDSGLVYPGGAGTQNLGDASNYWADVSYKTITDRGCLGCFDEGVELQDGTIVSDVEAICRIPKRTDKETVYGVPMLDYRHMPKVVYKPATKRNGTLYERGSDNEPLPVKMKHSHVGEPDKITTIQPQDGAEMSALISIMLGAIKELKAEIDSLKQTRN